jgi:hypothetical protein
VDRDAFNFYLSQLRIRIEQAFGLMTMKWSILRNTLLTSLATASKILQVCARLHNFVIDQDWEDDWSPDDEVTSGTGEHQIQSMTGSPLGFGYLPTVQPYKAIPGSSLIGSSILAFIETMEYRRPAHNVSRRELLDFGLM